MSRADVRRLAVLFALLALFALALVACEGDDDDDDKPAYTVDFTPAGTAGDGEIALVPVSADGDRLTVDVVSGGGFSDDAYGLAFKLAYDPAVIGFDSAEDGDALASSGVELIAMAHQRDAGELVFGISRSDTFAGVELEAGAAIARLVFEAQEPGETAMTFVEERSRLAGDRLEPIDVAAWIGGIATVR